MTSSRPFPTDIFILTLTVRQVNGYQEKKRLEKEAHECEKDEIIAMIEEMVNKE